MNEVPWLPAALEAIKWLIALLIPALCWLFKRHEDRLIDLDARLRAMDNSTERKLDADRQRLELRSELHDFRRETSNKLNDLANDANAKREEAREDIQNFKAEIGDRIEVIRTETNAKLDKLFDQIGILASTYAKRKR